MIRIAVDFNAMNKEGTHVWINTKIHPELTDILQEGLRVILYEQHDIQVEAVIDIQEDEQDMTVYYGIPDWSTRADST